MIDKDPIHITLLEGERCEIWINGKFMGYAECGQYNIRGLYRVYEDD